MQDERRDENQQQGSNEPEARSSSGAPEHSLKEREYRDANGQIHHHTNTYEEQHRDEDRR